MQTIKREDLDLLAKTNFWSVVQQKLLYQKGVYAQPKQWMLFIKITCLALGLSFFVAGVIFFFAFNWDAMHKFQKLSTLLVLVLIFSFASIFLKSSLWIKNSLLFAASLLVGGSFAVFGQIYQTGADAYDFFLAWTLFIALWSFSSRFPPLLLFFVILVQTTLTLYFEQVGSDLAFIQIVTILYIVQLIFYSFFTYVNATPDDVLSLWFRKTLFFMALLLSTIGLIWGIFDSFSTGFYALLVLVLISYSFAFIQSWVKFDWVMVCSTLLSVLFILVSFILKASMGTFGYFFATLALVFGIAAIVKVYFNLIEKRNEHITT